MGEVEQERERSPLHEFGERDWAAEIRRLRRNDRTPRAGQVRGEERV